MITSRLFETGRTPAGPPVALDAYAAALAADAPPLSEAQRARLRVLLRTANGVSEPDAGASPALAVAA